MKPKFALIDLPVYPKGVVSFSLFAVASTLHPYFEVEIFDLNIQKEAAVLPNLSHCTMVGLKVSAQNFSAAKFFTQKVKAIYPSITVVWGGELPSLLPDEALAFADVIVKGLFESVAETFAADFATGNLQRHYVGENNPIFENTPCADFSLLPAPKLYSSFMGLPLETSRGCTEKCAFCMVHTMQRSNYFLKSYALLQAALPAYAGHYINIIDYNFGVSKQHVITVSNLIKQSDALGWMAEMCIELLDDDDMLKAMSESGCKIIYCGLESIDEVALQSVHKMNTNHIENYSRIISKVQAYGIQIAAGVILGIANTNTDTFEKTYNFFQQTGIIYAKLTFLTYNPGTKVHRNMQKKGSFRANTIEEYDGVHLSYLPHGVNEETVLQGAVFFIKKFYALPTIIARSAVVKQGLVARLEYILFAYCYAEVYREWIKSNFLHHPPAFDALLNTTFEKSWRIVIAEKLLHWCRSVRRKSR